jgi:predicted RNA-binding protein YlxR (DUF448 family)
MDPDLLERIDSDPEAKEHGRSAFVRSAVELYLAARQRQRIEAGIQRAYGGQADALEAEVLELMNEQAWPED